MELNNHYEESDTKKEIYTELASGDNRTEQDRIYETLQHGTGELADKTTPSAKKCIPLLLWCTLVNSILIGLLIIAVSVSLYMSINVSKASNIKGTTVTGIWTNWSDWSPCNAKCGQGFKRRIRTCTSVSPKDNGFDCNGNGTETVQCQNRECSGDLQKLVTSLSQKIDKLEHTQGQIQTEILQNTNRLNETTELQKLVTTQSQKIDELKHAQGQIQTEVLQNLTNRLSETNVYYLGEVLQNMGTTLSQKFDDKLEHAQGQIQTEFLQILTNRLNAANVSVGFAVKHPDKSCDDPLKFKTVIYNTGDDYNVSTGVFTCRHPGLYFFTSTLFRSPGFRQSECKISVNGVDQLAVNSGTDLKIGYQSGSSSLVYRLKARDIVILSGCIGQDHMYEFSSFTGFRVSY
ncbi:uncharacterized protein LOC132754675 isoform X2 [Ruditapes philippinarum]|uniref:uncharacterized protein LOC132754675 isoform X2 n=1 Tax=Ruditapes philippinarum TaxID=129788 RepID=UPI00295B98F7|nr:uncharacterized protein LOC132754675 isoform X2 [Ruditapes philippinarum]